jgi:hypothetical protein
MAMARRRVGGRTNHRGRAFDASQVAARHRAASRCRAVSIRATTGGQRMACRMVTGKVAGRTGTVVRTPEASPALLPDIRQKLVIVARTPLPVIRVSGRTKATTSHLDISKEIGKTAGRAVSRGRPIRGPTDVPGGVRKGPVSQVGQRCPPTLGGRARLAGSRLGPGRGGAATVRPGGVGPGRGLRTLSTDTAPANPLRCHMTPTCAMATLATTRVTRISKAVTPAVRCPMTTERAVTGQAGPSRLDLAPSAHGRTGTLVSARPRARPARSAELVLRRPCRLAHPPLAPRNQHRSALRPARRAGTITWTRRIRQAPPYQPQARRETSRLRPGMPPRLSRAFRHHRARQASSRPP